jgi:hypothetical protein
MNLVSLTGAGPALRQPSSIAPEQLREESCVLSVLEALALARP